MMKTARLGDGDAHAPFMFHIGDEVAMKRDDGALDPEMHGVVAGGTCKYQEGGGSYTEEYEIKRSDGSFFSAGPLDLVKREPLFANVRDAVRIVREWVAPARDK